MIQRTGARLVLALVLFLFGAPGLVRADTVYLKNGAWIDGIVRTRNAEVIQVDIGKIGKIEIPLEEVYEIEKNSRTGSELMVSVEGRDLDVTVKPTPGDEDESEDGDEGEDGEDDPDSAAGDESAADEEDERDSIDPELKERIEKLVEDLQRQQSRYRVRAQRHLKAVGPPAIPFLLPLTSHESDLVRIAVFRLFESFGDDRVVEKCIEALVDPNEYVRDFSHRTLLRVTKENFGYKPFSSPNRREVGQAKWAKWWQDEQAALKDLQEQTR